MTNTVHICCFAAALQERRKPPHVPPMALLLNRLQAIFALPFVPCNYYTNSVQASKEQCTGREEQEQF